MALLIIIWGSRQRSCPYRFLFRVFGWTGGLIWGCFALSANLSAEPYICEISLNYVKQGVFLKFQLCNALHDNVEVRKRYQASDFHAPGVALNAIISLYKPEAGILLDIPISFNCSDTFKLSEISWI